MNNKQYLDFVISCEKKYKVANWKIGDMHLWPIIRCYLFRELVKSAASGPRSVKHRVMHTINYIKDWKHFVLFPRKCDVLFLGNGATKSLFEGGWYDYLVQPILEVHKKSGDKCLFLERGLFYRYPRSCKSFLTRVFEEVAGITAKVISMFLPYKNQELEGLLKELGIEDMKSIVSYTLGVKFIAYFYSLILSIARPKKVYIVCYYTMGGMAMCYACAKLGIPTIELQHGNTHNNFAYQGWYQTPLNGSYNTMPEAFWFWSEEDKKGFLKSNSKAMFKAIKSYVKGIPWVKFWKSGDKKVLKYQSLLKQRSKGYRLNILVTLRPNIFGGNEWDELASLIKLSEEDVFWWIRKHPSVLDTDPSLFKISSIKQNNVEYELASTFPLFSLLGFSNLHITTASNVAVEAKLFGVDTIFISDLAVLEMPHLINGNSIRVIKDLKKLQSFIKRKL
jgi:hypothetical protein